MKQSNRKARRAWAAARRKHTKRGKLYHVEIQHDHNCAIYTPTQLCNCNPHRVLKDDQGRTLVRVEGADPYNPLEILEDLL